MKTKATEVSPVVRGWLVVDARGQVLGRLAVKIANFLSGKDRVSYTPQVDGGGFVVVVNAALVLVTGSKENRKLYYHYTGYPSGLRSETLRSLRARKPEDLIRRAVSGMLPRNRLHDRRLARLFIYRGSEHPHAAQVGKSHAES